MSFKMVYNYFSPKFFGEKPLRNVSGVIRLPPQSTRFALDFGEVSLYVEITLAQTKSLRRRPRRQCRADYRGDKTGPAE